MSVGGVVENQNFGHSYVPLLSDRLSGFNDRAGRRVQKEKQWKCIFSGFVMPFLPDLEGWAVFARVADSGSFAGAAEELGLSRATISKIIARLEGRIGAALFNRTSRRLSLTEVGRASLERALSMLEQAQGLEENARSSSAAPRGLVRISAPVSFGLMHVRPLLPQLLAEHPGIDIDLRLDDAVVDLVAGGYDMAIRIAQMPDSGLRVRRIARMQMKIVAAPSLLEHRHPEHPRDLDMALCLGYGHGTMAGRWRLRRESTGEEASLLPAGRLRTNNGEIMLEAARSGQGFALAPDFLIWDDLTAGTLVPVLTDWSLPLLDLNIVLPPSLLRPARIAAVASFLTGQLSKCCWIVRDKAS
ncbi:Transcriptional regulators, LysR family [Granulibacter bethesdensis CGDNIH4]|nr:Transcriptional regulators, LysR family [Granulibacter bethesdensis CGDNIH4]